MSDDARRAAAPVVAWALAPEDRDIPAYKALCVAGEFDDHHIVQAFKAFEAQIVERERERCLSVHPKQSETHAYQADGYGFGWSQAIKAYREAIRESRNG